MRRHCHHFLLNPERYLTCLAVVVTEEPHNKSSSRLAATSCENPAAGMDVVPLRRCSLREILGNAAHAVSLSPRCRTRAMGMADVPRWRRLIVREQR